jgi:hypothetical protein
MKQEELPRIYTARGENGETYVCSPREDIKPRTREEIQELINSETPMSSFGRTGAKHYLDIPQPTFPVSESMFGFQVLSDEAVISGTFREIKEIYEKSPKRVEPSPAEDTPRKLTMRGNE